MNTVIDSDQHLYETRTTWLDHIDPDRRDDALRIEDDELGYPWLCWRGRRLQPVDVQFPAQTSELGQRRERIRAGLAAESSYDDDLPRRLLGAGGARRRNSRAWASTKRSRSPTSGCVWERTLDADLGALDRKHDRVEPLVRFGRRRWPRQGASGGARDVARRAVAHRRAGAPRARWRAPRDDGARARRWPAALASRSRRDLARVRRPRHHAGVPCRRPAAALRRRLVLQARRLVPAAARVGLPLDRRRARVHRPHPQRHARALPGTPHRHRRARARSGCRCT